MVRAEDNTRIEENVRVSVKNKGENEEEVAGEKLEPGEEKELLDKNLVVDEGLKWFIERVVKSFGRTNELSYIGFGTDNSDTTADMTGFQGTEAFRGVVLDENISKVGNSQVQLELVVAPGEPSSQPINFGEVGLFTGDSGDADALMFSRVGLGANEFEKTAEIEARIQWQIGVVNQ